jgi:uncharacterized protein (TIGR00369 family)
LLAARFERAPYNGSLGIAVESIELDRVRVRVPYKDENSNLGEALHGGVAASTINIAGALAAWTGIEERPELEAGTLDLSVNYLAAAIGEDIIATAEVLRRGKEITYSDIDIRNDAGKHIAKGLVTYRAFDRATVPRFAKRQRTMAADLTDTSAGDVPPLARALGAVPFIARLGMAIEHMKDGRAMVRMPFKTDNTDHGDVTHEGALAALIDTAGSMASWSITGLDFTFKASTVGMHVNYHAPAYQEDVVAYARTRRRNNEIFLNEVIVGGRASPRVVATGFVTYRIVVP